MTTSTRPTAPARRPRTRWIGLAAVLMSAPAVAVLAAPAHADVPEGWAPTESVNGLQAVVFFVGGPVLLFVLIALAVYLPAMIRGERLLPDHSGGEAQWLGGPRSGTRELTSAAHDETRTGGASGSW